MWIYFRTMEPGYLPWYIRAWEADLLIQVLQNLTSAIAYLSLEEVEVDFDGGETLMRSFSQEKGTWLNQVVKMPPRLVITPRLIVDNESLMADLKKRKRNNACLEFDVVYLPAPIQEKKGDRPYLPRMVLLVDRDSGGLIDQHTSDKDDEIEVAILEMLTIYITNYGRPTSINVRDDRAARYIGDYCQKSGIKLIEGKGVPAVDSFLGGLLDSLSR